MLSLTKGRSKLDVSRSKVALGLRASPYHWCHGTRDSTTQALEATRGPARPGPAYANFLAGKDTLVPHRKERVPVRRPKRLK